MQLRLLFAAIISLLPVASGAETLKISGEFIFDAGLYPETYGAGAGVTTGHFEFFYNPDLATPRSTTLFHTKNYDDGILHAYIDFDGARYVTSAESSLRNTIAVWDEYEFSNRDRVNFIIGLGAEEK